MVDQTCYCVEYQICTTDWFYSMVFWQEVIVFLNSLGIFGFCEVFGELFHEFFLHPSTLILSICWITSN